MTKDLKGDRWTCPNDRNLNLRSKLNAGWSCHTGKKTMRKDPQLSENELIEIQKVIQRSQMLEQKEKERVMRMMDRLENMKRNASQSVSNNSASNKCALCGDYLYLLRSMPNQCSSCRKILCTKCCIDTPYNNNNDSSNVSSRRNSFVMQQQSGPGNENRSVLYLCRLCSEQREFLKKSGVWFLKRFPNYMENKEKFSSTSNLSSDTITADEEAAMMVKQQQQQQPTPHSANQSRAFIIPSFVRRNLSSSPSSSSNAFKFWKTSISGSQAAAQSVEFDSLSCYSNDTEPPHSTSNSSDATTAPTANMNSTGHPVTSSSTNNNNNINATSPPPSSSFMHNVSEQVSNAMNHNTARSPSTMAVAGENHKLNTTSNTPASANASPSSFSKIFEFFPKSGTPSLLSVGGGGGESSAAQQQPQQPSSPNPSASATTPAAYSSQQLLNTSIRRFNQFFKRNTSASSSHEDEQPPYDARSSSAETSTSSNPNNNNNNSIGGGGNDSTTTTASINANQTTSTANKTTTVITSNITTTTTTSTSYSTTSQEEKEPEPDERRQQQQVVNSSFDNDLVNSPNMSSYRYYSNILSNLSDSKMNLSQLNDNASLNSTNSSSYSSSNNNNNNRKNSTNECSDDLLNNNNRRAFRPSHHHKIAPPPPPLIDNSKRRSSNEVSDGIGGGVSEATSSTSTMSNNSASIRQHNEAKFSHSSVLRMRSEILTRKTYKTSTEWCGSQLSLDDENIDDPLRMGGTVAAAAASGQQTTSRSSSKSTLNPQTSGLSSTNLASLVGSVSSSRPRVSSQAVNSLAKRIVSQNSSMMIGSAMTSAVSNNSSNHRSSVVAASSSSVIASASSLASSLNKLNFNN